MRWIIILAIIFAAFGAAYWWFTSLPSAKQLDMADSFFSDEGSYKLVGDDIAYGDNNRNDLDIWATEDDTQVPKPVLIFFYGGSWNSGNKDHYGFAAKAYAARGFLVVLPNYRLHPETVFPAMVEDSAGAIAWTHDNIAQYGGDPAKIFVGGHSAGAYNAAMAALDPQWLGRLGKNTDIIRGVIGLAGPYDFHPFTSDATKASFGNTPRPEITQPINYAHKDNPPLWLASGDTDDVVQPRNSRVLAQKVNHLGGRAEYREYTNIDHYRIIMAISRPFRSSAGILDDSVAFMQDELEK
ncbi:alpha/beta hydrolase [Sphingorhabdus sp. Alg239-R122]|uniref:alpha/beta hydrolase n=1 Tax=Sphingorhabdus sp. Alg239-R122 TaxID=2305989 RepID=UPI0013DAA066|nr:alpha/beta hydrolase [Sphingorhabdus sp. Alg239-R122]